MKYTILYDAELKRPGCVILQALGGNVPNFQMHFPSETWLTAPTANMKKYSITEDEIRKLSEITIKHFEQNKNKGKK